MPQLAARSLPRSFVKAVREAVVRLNATERQVRLIESPRCSRRSSMPSRLRVAYGAGEGSFTEMLDARRTLLAAS